MVNSESPQRQQPSSESDSKSKRNPFCSRCRNHGKSAQVKGHKRHCEYRDCQCEGCKLVEWRQLVSAAQIRRRRNQKQDEECGRTIEVSSPVLATDTARDPALFIAKTLIGQATSKQVLQQVSSPSTGPTSSAATITTSSSQHQLHDAQLLQNPSNSQDRLHQPHNIRPIALPHMPLSSCMLGTAANNNLGHHNVSFSHHLPMANHSLNHHQLSVASPLNIPSAQSHHHQLNLNQAHPHLVTHHHQHAASTPGSAFNDALHLFHFPNFIFPAGVGGPPPPPPRNQNSISAHAAAAAMNAAVSSSNSASNANLLDQHQKAALDEPKPNQEPNQPLEVANQIPSVFEQIAIVEQIYRAFGPLAIYAWLKVEHFDLNKVRDMIEVSRDSYLRLMDSKSRLLNYQSDNNSNENIEKRSINLYSNI